ncbi:peptidylprolyl isomerase [Paenibacillus soyae]|uniref:Peptidyl-prolyl cis-trans isomerase n=1 Tax=Paenibacillus soyae TaxID=2969249 RepID=A0A9X2MLM1_9BACL|nr:peptidylprolyl isomerase [Paenibacillus soyae]MCR2802901.1 peptidylprolyl isomerase [Paenibacillus soyae]
MSIRRRALWFHSLCLIGIALLLAGCGSNGDSVAVSDGASGAAGKALSWNKAPELSIDLDKHYEAVVTTSKGRFTIALDAKNTPVTVNNFVFLAEEGFYNGLSFHSIIESFMIQTGDPKGNGTGNAGYRIPDELDAEARYEEGAVAMFNTGSPNTGSSQFFICTGPEASNLDRQPNYTIFGKVTEGMDVVRAIAKTPSKDGKPLEQVLIETVTIQQS